MTDGAVSATPQWKCVAVSGQDNAASSTSIFVDYLKCILVPEQFGAFVVVANTEELGHVPPSQERNGVDVPRRQGSPERQGSQERKDSQGEGASQERECPDEITGMKE